MKLQSFINGVAIGLLLGILYAPASGEETRRKISRNANRIKDKVTDTYDDISDAVSDQVHNVKQKANDLLNKGEVDFKEAKNDIKNEVGNTYNSPTM